MSFASPQLHTVDFHRHAIDPTDTVDDADLTAEIGRRPVIRQREVAARAAPSNADFAVVGDDRLQIDQALDRAAVGVDAAQYKTHVRQAETFV